MISFIFKVTLYFVEELGGSDAYRWYRSKYDLIDTVHKWSEK